MVDQAYSLLCSIYESVIDEHTPFQSQYLICSQMKSGRAAEAVNVMQLNENGHAAYVHFKTGWITNGGNKHTLRTHTPHTLHTPASKVIYLPFTKLKNNCHLAIDIYSIGNVLFEQDKLPLIRIQYSCEGDTDGVAAV